ncbi:hypothetical protein AVL59_25135 [Streptomyces griseochromogenes]|uniref:Uncharacterized protein n=1 Tax=Streptomyces griseochromogenes TaxID=68214 RepID=A0A1B1B0P5_9ACTN|nr:hypothetical protein AVL59_25135 [Streptomyces griseochromogenes]
MVGAQAAQITLGDFTDAFGTAAHDGSPDPGGSGQLVAELGREQDVVTQALPSTAEELLIATGAQAVQLGRVQERDAEFVGSADGGDAALLARSPVGDRHAHRAQTDFLGLEALAAEGVLGEVRGALCHVLDARDTTPGGHGARIA